MPSISSSALQELYASETGESFLLLIEIDHPVLPNPLRVTSDTVQTNAQGHVWVSFPFALQLPGDEEDAPPFGRVAIDNVDRDVGNALRSITTPAIFSMQLVRGDQPDEVLRSFPGFKMRTLQGTGTQLIGELTLDDLVREPYPGRSFTATDFRGLVQ